MKTLNSYPLKQNENLWLLGNYYFSIYLLIGSQKTALVEAGVSAIARQVVNQLMKLNTRPDYIILTHPHTDHLTGIEHLQKVFPEAKIIIGKGAIEFLEHPKAEKLMITEDCYISKALEQIGINPDHPPITESPALKNTLEAGDGEKLDLGDMHLDIIPTPGHSPGQIMVHVPKIQAVFPSDALGFHFPGRFILPLFLTDFDEYIQTISLIKNLSPNIIGVGHQGLCLETAPEVFLENARESAINLAKKIKNDTRKDHVISKELFNQYYREEFTLYSEENIANCMDLLVKRARSSDA